VVTTGLPWRGIAVKRSEEPDVPEPTFVLVHGAWHGPWAWTPVLAGLEARGHAVETVALPSTGDDPAELGDLAADVAAVHGVLNGIDGSAVLVGHCYGGVPITQVSAARHDVSHLVYVCGFMLDVGESLWSAVGGEPAPWFEMIADGTAILPRDPVDRFYADVDPAVAKRSAARLRPQSTASFRSPVSGAGWHHLPSTYVITEQDRALPLPAAQEQMASHASRAYRIDTSHSPFLSQANELVDLIASAL
jgi:hypothetical protein